MVKWAGKLLRDYQQFLKDHKISAGSPREEFQVLLGGIESLVDGFQEQTSEQWYYFMQQLSQFWTSEEHMARPQVTILNLELDKDDIPYHKEHCVTIEPYTPFENRAKETIGYTAGRQFKAYPFLYLEETRFPSSQECHWALIYRHEELPQSLDEVNLFVNWEKNQDQVYDILWFLKNSRCQSSNVSLQFPMYSFGYPADDVPLPYRHSINNLIPYPHSLDFFLVMKGLEKKHFKWDTDDHVWRADIIWRSEDINLKDFHQVPRGIFKLHCLPLFHWVRKDLKTVRRRERLRLLGVDPQKIVWLKVSSHTELMPLPYYLEHSLDKRLTGYVKLKEGYLEVEATPVTSIEEGDEPYPLHIEALMMEDLKDKLTRYAGLKIDILDKVEAIKLCPPFLKKSDGEEAQIKANVLKDHHQFWHKWRLSLRQWDESSLKELLQDYFRHLSIGVEEIAVDPVQMRFIPGKGVFPVLAITFSVPEVSGKLWFPLSRFYDYLKERSPIYVLPYLNIRSRRMSVPIFSAEIL